ncbi:MAG: YHS domain-containing protein [Candidatus Acetothermia bacterium]|jgi:YHS domain-containing protein|nr:YHS domain-containing protein [Candidatus Acetothermia bacterium]MDH7505006.1 YHS domain-containing protein [Candidatus Acetothermia bacterium]
MPERVRDPVCGMELEEDQAAATYEYKGKTYYFCALSCREEFERDPEKYLGKETEEHRRRRGRFWRGLIGRCH